MKILKTNFKGLKIIDSKKFKDLKVISSPIFRDSRGSFREVFKKNIFKNTKFIFNISSTSKKKRFKRFALTN